jgi:hypothetical protein
MNFSQNKMASIFFLLSIIIISLILGRFNFLVSTHKSKLPNLEGMTATTAPATQPKPAQTAQTVAGKSATSQLQNLLSK